MGPIALGILLFFSTAGHDQVIDPNLLNTEGVEASERGDYGRAVSKFREAFAIEPNQPKILYNLQIALKNYSIDLARNGNVKAAIEACSEAVDLVEGDITVASNLAIFFHNLATDYLKEKEFENAFRWIEDSQMTVDRFQLFHIAPIIKRTHGRIFLAKARFLFLLDHDVPSAIEMYDKCIEMNPTEIQAYLDRSRIYYERESYEDAVNDLETAKTYLPDNEAIPNLIKRLKIEAKHKGITLTGEKAFFYITVGGGNQSQVQLIEQFLRKVRLEISRTLHQVNPKTPIPVTISMDAPLVRTEEWLTLPPSEVEWGRLELGGNGVNLKGKDFQKALRFNYVISLIYNLGGTDVPFWFASGLAQIMASEGRVALTDAEVESLFTAGDYGLLLETKQMTPENIARLAGAKDIGLANLQSKAILIYLHDTVRKEGISQLVGALRDGVGFEQALKDVSNLSSDQISRDWKQSVGIPTR